MQDGEARQVRGDIAPEPAAEALASAFGTIAADGAPAALVVRRGGRPLVELSAGLDAADRPFTCGTPVLLYSAVKPVTALTVLLAVADGLLALDDPVARHWPAFGANGKSAVTVRQLLAHGAGVPGWREPQDLRSLADRVAAADALAGAPPWWPPGEPGEHAVSYGHLIDGLLRHATGRDVLAWWDDVAAATGAAVTALPGETEPALLDDPDGRWRRDNLGRAGLMGELLRNPPELLEADAMNSSEGRALVAPAVTGYGSAAALADLWDWWVSPAAAARLGEDLRDASLRPQLVGYDHVLEREVAWGLGPQVDPDFVGMGGVGGCVAGHDPVRSLTIAFTTPRLGSLDRIDPLEDALAGIR